MRKFWRVIKGILGMLAITLVLCLCWAAAYWMVPYGYAFFNFHPNAFFMAIIHPAFGFFIFGMLMFTITRMIRPDKRQRAFWGSLTEAFEQIAKGDFNVQVSVSPLFGPNRHQDHPFNQLVTSINKMASQLGEMEHMRQEFVSNVSHEIQSPLTSIGGFARALHEEDLSPEERERYLHIIETESERLSKLSENLLKLTSLESEHPPFEPKPYRLDKQLRHIILSCELQWTKKLIEMDVSLEEVTVRADEDLMSQVWLNLLGNAVKFTPNGGRIGVHLLDEDGKSVVEISDNGMGMNEVERQHVFERFYKADKSRNRAVGGNGLGLAIVKKIVDMHEGEIHVASKKGKGTTFSVHLSA